MKKMFLILVALFFSANALSQTTGDLSLTCGGNGQLTQFVGQAGDSFTSSIFIVTNTPAIQTDYTTSIACGINYASFNENSLLQSGFSEVGGSSQATRENPVFFRFDQDGSGNCTATLSYENTVKSCNFPYTIGSVIHPPPVPPNDFWPIAIILVAIIVFGILLFVGNQKKS